MFVESWTSFVWARQRPPNVLRGLWGGEGTVVVRGGFPRACLARGLDFCQLHRLAFTVLSARRLVRGLDSDILLTRKPRNKSLVLLLQLFYTLCKACSGR